MDHKKHIRNIVQQIYRKQLNPGEDAEEYFERMTNMILNYVPPKVKIKEKKEITKE